MRSAGSALSCALLLCACGLGLSACGMGGSSTAGSATGGGIPPLTASDLGSLQTLRIDVDGVAFEVWLAQTPAQQQRGLMFATAEQLAPLPDGTPRGMLFPFPSDRMAGIVMNNTYVPLDLAYIRSDGEILEIHELTPLDGMVVTSGQPVRYALEVNAGELAARGIGVGVKLALPLGGP